MTRHNLADHISWLLSQEVASSIDVRRTTNSGINIESVEAVPVGEDTGASRPPQSPARNLRRTNVNTDSIQFARPPIPSFTSKLQEPPRALTEELSMGKLSSASRSTRPGLVSQQQLATPASTTSSTAASSTLSAGYASFLEKERGQTGTPSRFSSNRSKPLRTPQTPRQTPRPTVELKHDAVDAIDLTGDDNAGYPASHSSSSDAAFGDPVVIWREDSASRPEPPRSSRKRKSDELSASRPPKTKRSEAKSSKAKSSQNDKFDEFLDIDEDFEDLHMNVVEPTVEHQGPVEDFEYEVTETISRCETRTRKSLSRVSSIVENSSTGPPISEPATISKSPKRSTKSRSPGVIQVAVSPAPNRKNYTDFTSTQTPKRMAKYQFKGTIEDSEDDGAFSDTEKQPTCSPHTPIKNSPLAIRKSRSPGLQNIPLFDPTRTRTKESKSRVGSPLRPISRNVATRQDSIPSPFQRDSPTKFKVSQKASDEIGVPQTPSSSLTSDDKKLVAMYLNTPSSLGLYHQRVMNLLAQNAMKSMTYMDAGKTAPPDLKEERKAMLDMSKAYTSMEDLAARHKNLIAEKKNLLKLIMELLDTNTDASSHEERSTDITQEIRKVENEIGRLLHASGAIKDGFGTESNPQCTMVPLSGSVKPEGSNLQFTSASSTIGSAQIILQTQIPSAILDKPIGSYSRQPSEQSLPRYSSKPETVIPATNHLNASPSPVRRRVFVEQKSIKHHENWSQPEKILRQPNFFEDEHTDNFADYDFEGHEFDDLLEDDEEIQNLSRNANRSSPPIEDDYSDDDEVDWLEAAEEIEKRQSLPAATATAISRQSSSVQTISQPAEKVKKGKPGTKKTMYSHVDLEHAGMFQFPWSSDVKKALRERFKLMGFRYHQLDAINATLRGEDAFVLMPTGGGKSLCYQLPAIVQSGKTKGVTIVVSPLLSLMNDQVDHLKAIHIRAATLNGETAPGEKKEIYNALREEYPEQFIQLLYITPEMINKSPQLANALSRLHENKKLARIVIDEAHCVSQWGHDFRPDYVALGQVRMTYPNVPLMALTATATENVKLDVMHNLGMGECPVYAQSFNRPNLHYEVRQKKGKGVTKEAMAEIVNLIKETYRRQSGIIYTLSRKGCEEMAAKLQNDHNIAAHHYHASMRPEEKTEIQRAWQSGKIQVVVATIAFGMGIDKADVRFVIHYTIPKSLEGYYQETGRAGRDGKKSGCYLYYGYQDTAILKKFIYDSEASPEQKERQRKMLTSMIQYCENRTDCRRLQVLAYFGEKFAAEGCQRMCDNCCSNAVFKPVDFTKQAHSAMQIVRRVQKDNVTLLHCVDILRGAVTVKIKKFSHEQLGEFGAAKDIARGEIERLFYRLLLENALAENNVFNGSGFASQYLILGPNCREFLQGKRKLELMVQVSGSPPVRQRSKPQRVEQYPSTALTSPIAPSAKVKRPAARFEESAEEDEYGYLSDGFVVSDDGEDAFEAMPPPRSRSAQQHTFELGPPITADQRMEHLPEDHRVAVEQFADEARGIEERLRNKTEARRPFFTLAEFREMAIRWTLTVEDMKAIPNINIERVDTYGKKFIPLIKRYYSNYNEMMNQETNHRDMDPNHATVIVIDSDDEKGQEQDFDDDDMDEFEPDDDTEAAIQQAENKSRFFPNGAKTGRSNRKLPWAPIAAGSNSRTGQKASRGGFAKGRGGRRKQSRKSSGSMSGQSTTGVSKRAQSGGAKKSRAAKSTSNSSGSFLSNRFGYEGERGGGGGGTGGGIGMMPT